MTKAKPTMEKEKTMATIEYTHKKLVSVGICNINVMMHFLMIMICKLPIGKIYQNRPKSSIFILWNKQ